MEKRSPGPELKTKIVFVVNVYFWVRMLTWGVYGEIRSAALELASCLVCSCDPFPLLTKPSGRAVVCAPRDLYEHQHAWRGDMYPWLVMVGLTLACLWPPRSWYRLGWVWAPGLSTLTCPGECFSPGSPSWCPPLGTDVILYMRQWQLVVFLFRKKGNLCWERRPKRHFSLLFILEKA